MTEGDLLAGRYRIGRELGRGGFSIVYFAHDTLLATDVAIKLLVPPPAAAIVARERMRREVQAVRGLTHSNIVAVHDFMEAGDSSCIVMEYVAGPNLAERVRDKGPLAADDTIRLGRDIGAALAVAHQHGVLHRDVKPQNILLDPDGRARLTDFGSARLDGVTGVTRTGGFAGTLDYLAPELFAGSRGDGRGDIYALGLTLHVALTGQLPSRPSAHLPIAPSAAGYRPSQVAGASRIPKWLDDTIARATSERAESRFPSANAFVAALTTGAERGVAAAEPVARCALCDEADPFGLTVCVRCAGADTAGKSHAILVWSPSERASREAVRTTVQEMVKGQVAGDAADAVCAGERALLLVPEAAAHTVLEHLSLRGVSARAVATNQLWRSLPLPFYALGGAMAATGVFLGTTVPEMTWASPVLAACWGLLGVRAIGRPALTGTPLSTKLNRNAEREIVAALTELPAGVARDLLADIARVAHRVAENRSGTDQAAQRDDLSRVLLGACNAARQVAEIDESLREMEPRAQATASPRLLDGLDLLGRTRDRLVQQLLGVLTSMGRTQAETLRLAAETSGGDETLVALTTTIEESITRRADAMREINEYVSADARH